MRYQINSSLNRLKMKVKIVIKKKRKANLCKKLALLNSSMKLLQQNKNKVKQKNSNLRY